jgi:D-alanine-D-alanine ligase
MGGVSSERDISMKSGKGVVDALMEAGHTVLPVCISAEDVSDVIRLNPDVVFIALHGRFGEDGGVQAMLEHAEIPYTGSDSQASRWAMDKMASKCFFISNDIPTPDFRVVMASGEKRGGGSARERARICPTLPEVVDELGLPLVTKPLREGSSVGVSIAHSLKEVRAGVAEACKYGRQALIEKFVAGREVTVGILGEEALPIIEIGYEGTMFSFDAKYRASSTRYDAGVDLGKHLAQKVQDVALRAHRVLGCSQFSRVDIRLDTSDQPFVLEVNTIPGFTPRSLFPKAAAAAGIEFPDLCDRIVRDAVAAHGEANVRAIAV